MDFAANATALSAAPQHGAATQGTSGTPTHRRMRLALPLIATAQLMVILDATIVNVALPHIQHVLGFSGGLQWGPSTPFLARL